MNISKANLLTLFNTGTNQYVIPFFQRPFVWKIEDCETLFDDVLDTVNESVANPHKEHFIGTIITKNGLSSTPMTAKFDLVDGQQRMTAFSLLIKALANSVDLTQPDAGYLYENINNHLSFKDPYGKIHLRISHNRIDRVYYNKIMEADAKTNLSGLKGKSNIINTYLYFLEKLQGFTNNEILNINLVTLNKFPAISMVLDHNDDEQEIFDTINSLGVKLTTSELLKNHIFSNEEMRILFKDYWEDVFEIDEETVKFWNTKKTAGRLYRENIDVLLYCFLIIEKEKDVSLEHLFRDYKEWLKNKSFDQKKAFLEDLKAKAELFASFPSGTELNDLKFDQIEKRFFHVIENLNVTTIYPLVLFLYKEVKDTNERLICLSLLESYLVRRNICKLTTKNYNNLFISIIKSLKESASKGIYTALQNILFGYAEDTNRFPSDEDLKTAFAISILSNQHAKETLYNIALYQVQNVLNDLSSLSSKSFSVEHMMPKKWEQNWNSVTTQDEINTRNYKLLTLGNLTVITKNLNSKLRNSSWINKREVLSQYSALPLTTNYTSKVDWSEDSISSRATDLYKIAIKIWKK
jgi:uncharacterized protein with ParB-like and HNH nuclease domain